MKLIMTGLDHKRSDLNIRENFAITREMAQRSLTAIKNSGKVGGCVIISTCNRTELYASVSEAGAFAPSKALCEALNKDYGTFKEYFTEKTDADAIEQLCRVASGADSQIIGDDQIITQVREALEFSREQGCTDSYIETMFKLGVSAGKAIKTNVILKSLGAGSIPGKAVEKLKAVYTLAGKNAVVIGNGQMGRLVSELLIGEGVNVTVTLREYKKGVIHVPKHAASISYKERYKAIEHVDMVISATRSPHFTVFHNELSKLAQLPDIFVDLAVPRDIEPTIKDISGVTLLTLDDISGGSRALSPESVLIIEKIIDEHIEKYYRWLKFKQSSPSAASWPEQTSFALSGCRSGGLA